MSSQVSNEDQFLLGAGGQSASFENIGDYVEGVITATQVTQQTDFESGDLLWWDAEKTRARQQLVVTLQTELRDPEIEDDDGIRKLYVKGSTKAGSRSLHDATASAVRAAGAKGLKPGGWGRWAFVAEEAATKKGMSPRKLYEAVYRQPDQEQASGQLLGTAPAATTQAPAAAPPAAAPPAAAPPAAAPPAAAPPAAGAASPVDNAKALIAAGIEDSIIIAATGLDPVVIAALRNQ